MIKLPLPDDTVKTVFTECITNYRDATLRQKLANVVPLLVEAENTYMQKVTIPEVHTFPIQDHVGDVSVREMSSVYKDKFAHINGPGRKYYNKLMSAPRHGICPYCGVRTVSNLDHFLPQSRYPSLTLTPSNLVPSCLNCNMDAKKALTSVSTTNTPFHPYFDEVERSKWLKVNLYIDGDALVPHYFVIKPTEWNNITFERAEYHLNLFGLKELYGIHAATEIENCQRRWSMIYQRLGENGLHEAFMEDCESRETVSFNSWQSALYRALSEHTHVVCTWLGLLAR